MVVYRGEVFEDGEEHAVVGGVREHHADEGLEGLALGNEALVRGDGVAELFWGRGLVGPVFGVDEERAGESHGHVFYIMGI